MVLSLSLRLKIPTNGLAGVKSPVGRCGGETVRRPTERVSEPQNMTSYIEDAGRPGGLPSEAPFKTENPRL